MEERTKLQTLGSSVYNFLDEFGDFCIPPNSLEYDLRQEEAIVSGMTAAQALEKQFDGPIVNEVLDLISTLLGSKRQCRFIAERHDELEMGLDINLDRLSAALIKKDPLFDNLESGPTLRLRGAIDADHFEREVYASKFYLEQVDMTVHAGMEIDIERVSMAKQVFDMLAQIRRQDDENWQQWGGLPPAVRPSIEPMLEPYKKCIQLICDKETISEPYKELEKAIMWNKLKGGDTGDLIETLRDWNWTEKLSN